MAHMPEQPETSHGQTPTTLLAAEGMPEPKSVESLMGNEWFTTTVGNMDMPMPLQQQALVGMPEAC